MLSPVDHDIIAVLFRKFIFLYKFWIKTEVRRSVDGKFKKSGYDCNQRCAKVRRDVLMSLWSYKGVSFIP